MTDAQTLTIPQAARILGVSPRTAQRDVAQTGRLAGMEIILLSGRRRVRRSDLDVLLQRKVA